MSFDSLNLHETLVRAVTTAGYAAPTDVQQRAIPPALAGQDLMVSSNTGSGKTASLGKQQFHEASEHHPTGRRRAPDVGPRRSGRATG